MINVPYAAIYYPLQVLVYLQVITFAFSRLNLPFFFPDRKVFALYSNLLEFFLHDMSLHHRRAIYCEQITAASLIYKQFYLILLFGQDQFLALRIGLHHAFHQAYFYLFVSFTALLNHTYLVKYSSSYSFMFYMCQRQVSMFLRIILNLHFYQFNQVAGKVQHLIINLYVISF